MALQASIPVNYGRAAAIQRMRNLLDYGLGIGQGTSCVTYGDLTTKLNTLAGMLSLPTFNPANENAGSIRDKINAISSALGLDRDLDLSYKPIQGIYWNAGAPYDPATQITDTHNDNNAKVFDAAGLLVPLAANVLSRTNAGQWSYPTRTNYIRNSSLAGVAVGNPGVLPTNWFAANAGSSSGLAHEVVGLSSAGGYTLFGIRIYGTQTGAAGTGYLIDPEAATQINALTGEFHAFSVSLGVGAALPAGVTVRLDRVARTSGGSLVLDHYTDVTAGLTTTPQRYVAAGALGGGGTVAKVQPRIQVSGNLNQTFDITLWIGSPQFETGPYASPWISTSTVAVQRLGNTPTISGLGASLANGASGFIKVNLAGVDTQSNVRFLSFTDGTGNNRVVLHRASSGQIQLLFIQGGVTTAVLTLQTVNTTGLLIIAFTFAAGFLQGQIVGQSAVAAVTTGTVMPVLNRAVIGGNGYDLAGNMYAVTEKLELSFTGPFNQAKQDAMYQLALAA